MRDHERVSFQSGGKVNLRAICIFPTLAVPDPSRALCSLTASAGRWIG